MRILGTITTLLILAALCLGCPSSPYTIQLTPAFIGDSIPGQRCVFLVEVAAADGKAADTPIPVSATAPGADVIVENASILPGQLAEVTVIPRPLEDKQIVIEGEDGGRDIALTVRAGVGCVAAVATANVHVTSEEQDLTAETAAEMRDLFVPWLTENHPELNITADTDWTGTIVTPHILVVSHYLFFNEEWEMHVYWHVMIPPYDWAYIELRHRFDETVYSLAFEIPSRSAEPPLAAQPVTPSEALWR